MATQNFINECKKGAYENRLGKVSIGSYIYKTITGNNISFNTDATKEWNINDLQGNTQQTGTPTPDSPVPIQTVTGRQVVSDRYVNIFDFSVGGTAGQYLTNTGEVATGADNLRYSDYIELTQNTPYLYFGGIDPSYGLNAPAICFYDSTKTFISGENYLNRLSGSFAVPTGAKYIRTSYRTFYTSLQLKEEKQYELNLGKNILDLSSITSGENQGTIYSNNNGTITLNGTATANNLITSHSSTTGILLTAGTYTLSANNEVAGSSSNYIRLCTLNGTAVSGTGVYLNTINNKITFTLSEDTKVRFQIRTGSGTQYNDYVIKPQLEKGNQASSFSPYFTPIELNKIGTYQDSIKKSTGKNLFDKNGQITLGARLAMNGTEYYSDASNYYISDWIKIQSNTTYTKNSPTADAYHRVCFYTSNSVNDFINYSENNTFTTPATAVYLRFCGLQTELNTTQIEEGSQATDFEPFLPKGTWYIEKKVGSDYLGRVTFDKNNTWSSLGNNTNAFYKGYLAFNNMKPNESIMCDRLGYVANVQNYDMYGIYLTSNVIVRVPKTITTPAELKTWFSNNNTKVIYPLASPTYTEITNEELLGQLNAIENASLFDGINNIVITSEDLSIIISLDYQEYDEDELYNQSNNLVEFTIKDTCVNNGTIVGATNVKSLDVSFLNLDKDVELADKIIKPSIGVKYSNNDTEYIDYDEFTIENSLDKQTSNKNQITAYDGFNLLDKEYICSIGTFPCTVQDFYIDFCNQIKLLPESTTFDNSDIPVSANPFTNHETLRDVLSEIEKVSCTIANINWNTKIISLDWLSNNVDYEFQTSDYSTLEGGDIVYGPLNCLILGNQETTGENVVIQDSASIETNGETQLYIDAKYFLYNEALRSQAITKIWAKLNGLTYTNFKLTCYYGKPFLNKGNKIRVNTTDNKVFDSYILSFEHKYNGAFSSILEAPVLTKTEEEKKNIYNGTGIKQRMARTELIVDKQGKSIESITQTVTDVQTDLSENYYTLEETNQLIQTAQTGLTNIYSKAGGNNIFRNTGLWFENIGNDSQQNPYEFWAGIVVRQSEDKAVNSNALLLQNATLSQEQVVPNGKYTISFKYKKLIELGVVKVKINDVESNLTETTDTEFVSTIDVNSQHINIQFINDTNNSCEIYDLMVNAGEIGLAYSQNQNETTTDTVNIGKGIEIKSTDVPTTFRANADGVRIYSNDDLVNPKTKFTDKGTETDYLKTKNEAEIAGVLIQKVGNHTWFTKL